MDVDKEGIVAIREDPEQVNYADMQQLKQFGRNSCRGFGSMSSTLVRAYEETIKTSPVLTSQILMRASGSLVGCLDVRLAS